MFRPMRLKTFDFIDCFPLIDAFYHVEQIPRNPYVGSQSNFFGVKLFAVFDKFEVSKLQTNNSSKNVLNLSSNKINHTCNVSERNH